MAEGYVLKASARDRVGKGAARALRREGLVPAVIYGDKKPALPIAIPMKESTLALHRGGFMTHLGKIDIDGTTHTVIAKDYQLDPVRDDLIHVDFLRVAKGSELTVDVPVHFINEEKCPGIKQGGVLNVVRHTVEMTVPADSIPEALIVDLSTVKAGDSIHISAIDVPAGCTPTITDRDFTVATIAAPGGGAGEDEEETADEEESED
ncbi:MAG: 50S ribosomal protein L25/general stress protein Ctc [Stappia sp.]|uniref:50S ribosomal protein L25/general stress protein Ctc n=1 Tax=Stappia sp. TaxID=1870903 RepID=UPI000C40BF41|nr:50S ribosomal protein L25/general stress protein Ctc [Stappia sp.]MAB00612.1 50S ribosomal protein L25/general stress protein Ctc [Stappia sp.]MBM18682.1 50S ribosomal protein L25/general stress protein Ctc [Stappia sp.]